MKDCWPDCSPCNPNDTCRPEVDLYHEGLDDDRCWPNCNPCNPDDFCAPDYDEGGK